MSTVCEFNSGPKHVKLILCYTDAFGLSRSSNAVAGPSRSSHKTPTKHRASTSHKRDDDELSSEDLVEVPTPSKTRKSRTASTKSRKVYEDDE